MKQDYLGLLKTIIFLVICAALPRLNFAHPAIAKLQHVDFYLTNGKSNKAMLPESNEFSTSQQKLSSTNYTAYGKGQKIANAKGFGYNREYTDENSNLVYLRARFYHPATQTFITRDTKIDEWNKYGFTGGNPVMNIDPSGHSKKKSFFSNFTTPEAIGYMVGDLAMNFTWVSIITFTKSYVIYAPSSFGFTINPLLSMSTFLMGVMGAFSANRLQNHTQVPTYFFPLKDMVIVTALTGIIRHTAGYFYYKKEIQEMDGQADENGPPGAVLEELVLERARAQAQAQAPYDNIAGEAGAPARARRAPDDNRADEAGAPARAQAQAPYDNIAGEAGAPARARRAPDDNRADEAGAPARAQAGAPEGNIAVEDGELNVLP
ncbi:RHS repeat-associated core domain-containing protein [Facilibium subflavum]|uniref:RHS repeat-associated core domain-containing protein n=1 Tax=Facilibium subflavum TaxID=2219058 RepID=UPI000E65A474|nr:RHS repeat-associated core domain-containing protein [Facilibium subflavum]